MDAEMRTQSFFSNIELKEIIIEFSCKLFSNVP